MDNSNASNDFDSNVILPVLKKIQLFANLDENLHKEIIKHIILMYYPANYQIFKEGEIGDALYVIRKGKISIHHEPASDSVLPETVSELNDGEFFGEMSLISETPHTASAKTVEESEVFVLNKENFNRLLQTNPTLAEKVSSVVIDRTNKNDKTTI